MITISLIFTFLALAKAGLVIGSLRLSVRNTFGVPSLCNLFNFLFIQTLINDCSHIEDLHLPFCAHLINVFSFLMGVELRHFFHLK